MRRLLFLDDDPHRAERFLKDYPQAVWVTNVPDCVARLDEPWDEVHLDHDLGGKVFVDSADSDCGMEVIRWLCKEPRPHLQRSLFFVHTHNAAAGLLMVLCMRGAGYKAEFRPFGHDLERLLLHNEDVPRDGTERASTPAPRHRLPGPLRWVLRAILAGLAASGSESARIRLAREREGHSRSTRRRSEDRPSPPPPQPFGDSQASDFPGAVQPDSPAANPSEPPPERPGALR